MLYEVITLRKLRRRLVALVPELRSYGSVDNGPVLERHWGYWAGLGWFGLHGGLIHPEQGSWFSLATLLLDRITSYNVCYTKLLRCASCKAA